MQMILCDHMYTLLPENQKQTEGKSQTQDQHTALTAPSKFNLTAISLIEQIFVRH